MFMQSKLANVYAQYMTKDFDLSLFVSKLLGIDIQACSFLFQGFLFRSIQQKHIEQMDFFWGGLMLDSNSLGILIQKT